MKTLISRWLSRLAPQPPICDLTDHPDIRRMTPHERDDLPWPRCAEKNDILKIASQCK